jgi:hypothetical protein
VVVVSNKLLLVSIEQCRNVLKYSYVIGYYLEDAASTNLFEYLQEDLEKTVEQLSEALEVQEKTKLTDIMKDKVKLITMTKVAKTRLGNFLSAVCNPRFQSLPRDQSHYLTSTSSSSSSADH